MRKSLKLNTIGHAAAVGILAVAGCIAFLLPAEAMPRTAGGPLVNAHRGSRAEYDDNAAEGFAECLKSGVRGFETDIRLTKDDELVIMHDKDVSRTTEGKGDIHDMTEAEVTSLTMKRSGRKVPTARRLMETFRGVKDIRIEFEMKESTSELGAVRGETYCRKLHDLAAEMMERGTYIFTSFNFDTLKTMKRLFPDAPVGAICAKPLTPEFVDRAAAIGCSGVAPLLKGTTRETVDYAHRRGLGTTVWMVESYRDYAKTWAIGSDTCTSDHAMALAKKATAKRRLVCLDLDATLCQHRSPVPAANRAALQELMKRYKCVMVGAGNAPRIHRQMEGFPIDIIANYGMQEAVGEDGNFRIVRAVTNMVDRQFFREKTDYLRKKYGYTEYDGESLEFHASGMVTFGLLGTKPSAEHKVAFDPDRKKRKAMYKEVCEIFKDYSVFIGGSTSFDFAGKQYNKYDAIMDYASRNGYARDEIVFVGDDFGEGGGDSHVRLKGMDYIQIEDYRDFPRAVSILLADKPAAERIVRPARHTRGNTGLAPVQAIDRAGWIAHPDDRAHEAKDIRVLRFRRTFRSDGSPLEFDVTADERFYLTVDGRFVARGPHRGTVENWTYQSYRMPLTAGEHVVEATVWRLGAAAPLAQMSHRLGFCFKAEGAYDAALTTGKAAWKVCTVDGLSSIGKGGGTFGTGDGFLMVGSGLLDKEGTGWRDSVVIRAPMDGMNVYGIRQKGWLLFPSQLPDQTEDRVRPGRFVTGGEMRFPLVVPAGEKRTILWDLDRYICAYPEAVVKGGRGGRMSWRWAEALRGPSADGKHKGEFKGNRNEWQGKKFDGCGDVFVFDGRAKAVFQPPWFRCGRWCELKVEAGAEPVTINDLSLIESRYPLACESTFETVDDPQLAGVQRIAERSMQMCSHEMLFDCPYYEQQMYPGDTRVQLNVISSMTADDAIIRRAIEFFDLNRRDDGMVPFNFPTTGTQEGASYTLCYLGMYPDYLMNHANVEWLRARLPGMRATLSGFETYERADGILENLPGWSFLDWVPRPGWDGGWAPGSHNGGANAELNLFYLAALQGAARIERALGNPAMAEHWQSKANRLAPAIVATFYDKARGVFASDAAHQVFSEHAQCLALLTDVVTGDEAKGVFERLVTDAKLCPTSVYFSYYLFETYFKFGRADLFLKRLDLWKGYVKLGATTCLEAPEYPGNDSRSDCHAWGAHPLWFLRTGVAGIRSDAPFYARVRIAPQPGGLSQVRASYPHPSGKLISVDLRVREGAICGTVDTPVAGTFVWQGVETPLVAGFNVIGGPESPCK